MEFKYEIRNKKIQSICSPAGCWCREKTQMLIKNALSCMSGVTLKVLDASQLASAFFPS